MNAFSLYEVNFIRCLTLNFVEVLVEDSKSL